MESNILELTTENIESQKKKYRSLKCKYLLTKVDILGHTIKDGSLYPKVDKL